MNQDSVVFAIVPEDFFQINDCDRPSFATYERAEAVAEEANKGTDRIRYIVVPILLPAAM